jgi:hypothetical protein
VKIALCLAILATPAVWADEVAERVAVEAIIAALNTPPAPRPSLFTADFSNAAELKQLREAAEPTLTVVISREPMGEARWYAAAPLFVTRSVTFVARDTAVVVAVYERQQSQASQGVPVLFVLKNVLTNEGSNWRIASFRVLPEAESKARR